jgi:hypothetical protein
MINPSGKLFCAPFGFAKFSAMMIRRIVAFDLKEDLGPTTPIRLVGSG